jgi:hypothetical protein
MTWLDALLDRGREAKTAHARPVAVQKPPARVQAKPEVQSVWVQTAAPRLPEYPGAAEPAFYFVSDGVLTLCDEHGKPERQTHQLKPDEDPRRIAGRLKKAALALTHSDFNRRLNYPSAGVA